MAYELGQHYGWIFSRFKGLSVISDSYCIDWIYGKKNFVSDVKSSEEMVYHLEIEELIIKEYGRWFNSGWK